MRRMRTRLKPNYEVNFYKIENINEYADTDLSIEPLTIKALAENVEMLDNISQFNDATGTVDLRVWPEDYKALRELFRPIVGLYATFDRYDHIDEYSWYRVSGCEPGESLVDGTQDFAMLSLIKVDRHSNG